MRLSICAISMAICYFTFHAPASGVLINQSDAIAVPASTVGSGNGTLDVRIMTFSGAEIPNSSGSFNGDNGNNSLPNNNGTTFFMESYVTTVGEIQTFYQLNFPDAGNSNGTAVDEIVLFLDLNERSTSDHPTNNFITKLDIVSNPLTIQGSPNPAGDVSSSTQNGINQVYTGGTLEAELSPSGSTDDAIDVDVVEQGAGFADYAIFTGINPFSLNSSDTLLFNISMAGLSNGSEEIFLSGTFSGNDVLVAIPEPSQVLMLALPSAALIISAVRKQRRARTA